VALAEDDSEDQHRAELSDKAMEHFRKAMRIRKGKRDGWTPFCKAIGGDPDAMTKPFLGCMDSAMNLAEAGWEAMEVDCPDAKHEAEAVATRECEALLEAWRDRHG
jgi:hypothetical protein